MKKIIFFVIILFSNHCFSDKWEDFNQHLYKSASNFDDLHHMLEKHIFYLEVENNSVLSSYYVRMISLIWYAELNPREACNRFFGPMSFKKIEKLQDLLDFVANCKNSFLENYNKIKNLQLNTEDISSCALLMLPKQIDVIKRIEKNILNLKLNNNSILKSKLNNILDNLINIQNFLLDYDKYILSFLKIECINKKFDLYVPYIYNKKIIDNQQIELKNINSILSKIDLTQLKINEKYKFHLKKIHNDIKQFINSFLKKNKKNNLKKLEFFDIEEKLFTEYKEIFNHIKNMYYIINNPFSLIFSDDQENISLNDNEKIENMSIYLDMLHGSSKSSSKKLNFIKKNHNKNDAVEFKKQKNINIIDSDEEKIINLNNSKNDTELFELNNNNYIDDSIVELKDKSSNEINSAILDQNTTEECKKWLNNIMNEASLKNDAFFGIFCKAHDLYKQLDKHETILLDQIQQGISDLALRLQEIKSQNNNQNNNFSNINHHKEIIVPKNYEDDFRYLMYTPITYLKNNIRFGFIKRLIEGLDGKIDLSRAGSRIALHLNEQTISLHIHDSENGVLDAGRIASLREFFINAGVKIKVN